MSDRKDARSSRSTSSGSQGMGFNFNAAASLLEGYMNHLANGGLYKLWEDSLVSDLKIFPGMKHLDVAGATGDVALRILEKLKKEKGEVVFHKGTQIYVCDNNPNMLEFGKKRAQERGLGDSESLVWIEGDVEKLPFEDNSMDSYTFALGIRNATHIEKALSEAHRVLKKGGTFSCLELSLGPRNFKEVYDLYSLSDIPALRARVAGDSNPFESLKESVLRFPSQEVFGSMMKDAGFQVKGWWCLVGGGTIHHGVKV